MLPRCKAFHHHRLECFERQGMTLDSGYDVTGSCGFFNPTHACFRKNTSEAGHGLGDTSKHELDSTKLAHTPSTHSIRYAWRSRDNRKGRHVLILPKDSPHRPSTSRRISQGLWRMLTVYAYWDISWWVAILFSFGSAIFILCALFYWLPIAYPETEFANEATTGGGVASFVGATLFQVGAVLLIFESVNENQTGCFGWAVEELFEGRQVEIGQVEKKVRKAPEMCEHVHQRASKRTDGAKAGRSSTQQARKWQWWPSWKELREHYIHEIGFVSNVTLAAGATIFYVTGIMSLPGVYDQLSQAVFGYMLETQTKWWKPAFQTIGWHIGLWNMIGSVGWTLSAAFGYCNPSWCEYQSDLTLLWASFAFLVGSMLLWYEALDKYPIETI
ncbi:uncharacterized protein AB675_1752 [Cyphellophora attinorum]|uniref:Integral membrane protein n=1 Tax=Cyphellophora attinorum TaxID=1664694 RepID=A0A0N1HXZ1_9EURO|nr:uncharacterized protein AB675_1752 [Phialophora attinorum]KPI43045.1 hypothetical protein AB675_1752 [Phialophora attinorum]